MAGYENQLHVDLSGLAGKLGEVCLSFGATAWDLAKAVHSEFPLPAGMFWKFAIENDPLTDKLKPITRMSTVTCVKYAPPVDEQVKVVEEVQDLLFRGRSVDELPLENHLIWLTLQSLTFGRDFNQSMNNVALPSGLQSLTFGQEFVP